VQLLLIAKSGAAGHRESFSSTGAVMVKTKKQKKEIQRQRLKAEEAKSAARTSIQLKQKPDPILGYSTLIPNGHLKWEQCELSKLIIKKEDVWAGRIAPLPQDQRLNNPPADRPANDNSDLLPLVLNFGLDENAHQKAILFDGLPKMKELVMRKNTPLFDPSLGASSSSSSPSSDSSSTETFEQNEEDLKKLRLMRILDLRNSNSQGIDKFIKLRILKAFSPKDPHRPEKLDPGCSEVQGTHTVHPSCHLSATLRDPQLLTVMDKWSLFFFFFFFFSSISGYDHLQDPHRTRTCVAEPSRQRLQETPL
jgi:hypothetical protein